MPNGAKYEGSWVNDKREGQGIYLWENGDKYEGNFHENERSGKGTLVYSNGDQYNGSWEHDKKHGHGKIVYASGAVYEGNWDNNNATGEVFFYEDILRACLIVRLGLSIKENGWIICRMEKAQLR